MIFNSLLHGFKQTLRMKRMIAIFFLTNLLMGLLVMIPLRNMLNDFAGNSLMGESLTGGINWDFIFEFFNNNSGGIKMLGGLIAVAAMMYWLAGLFISGGAFSLFLKSEGWNGSIFWSDSAKYFGRFFRLWLWSIPLFVVLYGIQFLETGFVRVVFGSDPYENVKFWGNAVRVGLGYLGIIFYYVIFDYARMYVVETNTRKMRIALKKSILFSVKNFWKVFGLAVIFFLVGILFLLMYRVKASFLSSPDVFVIFLLIIVQQIYILLKSALKLMLYSSQVNLYQKYFPKEIPIETVPIESEPGNVSSELSSAV
ncbi:MAG: hypothetical protein HY960_11995 [Ignavibacteriae bacterium]|nr:hypothetical protein [Ignavibacteriota bacterium]